MCSVWLKTMRLCLFGIAVQAVFSVLGFPYWMISLGGIVFLWGVLRLRHLHGGFSSAFLLTMIRILLSAAGILPVLWRFVGESVFGLLFPLCHGIALACFADGFWAVRLSRGLYRNRSAAAVVFLQILIDMGAAKSTLWLLSTVVILFAAALWYYDRAARELDVCEDPPVL